jgi:hypothetical protein
MKKTTSYCDVCGKKDDPKSDQFRIVDLWGQVALKFNIPSVHSSHNYEDCCPTCAKAIAEAVDQAIEKIKSPLEEALK